MANYILDLSDEIVTILMQVADQIGIPPEVEKVEERLELAIDAMANSVDSATEVATRADGTPLQMQAALDAILNPDISSSFTQPTTAAIQAGEGLTWEGITNILGTATCHPDIDDVTRKAMLIVFNELPQDEWTGEHAEKLIDQTIALLMKNKEVIVSNE